MWTRALHRKYIAVCKNCVLFFPETPVLHWFQWNFSVGNFRGQRPGTTVLRMLLRLTAVSLETLASPVLGLIFLNISLNVTQFCFFHNYIHNRLRHNSVTPAFSVPSLKPAGACFFMILVCVVDQIFCTFTLKQGKLTNLKHKSQRMIPCRNRHM